MTDRNDKKGRDQSGQNPDDRRRKPEYKTGSADVGATPDAANPPKVPTGEPGGSDTVRGTTGTETRQDTDRTTGAGLPPSAAIRSEQRDTSSSPGSTDHGKASNMGPTGLEGPSGGTAGVTGVSGPTGVVGRPPEMEGTTGVGDVPGNPRSNSADSTRTRGAGAEGKTRDNQSGNRGTGS